MSSIAVTRPWFGAAEEQAVVDVLRSGWVTQGPRVAEFEQACAEVVGARHAVALSSCTTGLHLALVAAGIGPGDEVIVPSLSFIASTTAVRYVGALPVFADVDEDTLCLTPDTVGPLIGPATRAVMVVHQAGVPADVVALRRLCDAHGLTMIEDAACAIGSTTVDPTGVARPVGAGSSLAVFSFHPRKLITTGEGGMVVTQSEEWADRIRRLRDHGSDRSAAERHALGAPAAECYVEPGFNYRMTDLQAAVGVAQLDRLPAILEARRWLAHRYQQALAAVPDVRWVDDPPHGTTNYQSFWIRLDEGFPVERDELLGLLAEAGISARRGVMATHLEPAHADLGRPHLPVTERSASRSIILPLDPRLAPHDQDRVIDVIAAVGVGAPC